MNKGLAAISWLTIGLLVLLPLAGIFSSLVQPTEDPLGMFGHFGVTFDPVGMARLAARSIALALMVALGSLPVGIGLAWAEHRLSFPGRRALMLATLLPLAVPSYILASALSRQLTGSLRDLTGLPAATVALTVVTVPLIQLIVGTALHNSSASEEEAARLLGANDWRVFRTVAWPKIRHAASYGGLLAMLYALSDFGAVAVLDAPVLTFRLYKAVASQNFVEASFLSGVLLACTLPLFVVVRWVRGSSQGTSVANPRPPARRPATGWQMLGIYSMGAFVIGLGLMLPIGSMLTWVFEGIQHGQTFASLQRPLTDSLYTMVLGTIITIALAIIPAIALGRNQQPGLDTSVYLTSALPGVLLAFGWILALVFAARIGLIDYRVWLFSGVALWLAYASRFLAEGMTPIKAAITKMDPRLHESHQLLGAPDHTFARRVGWPIVRPAVGSAAVIVALAILKELPVTLLLSGPSGLHTLAFRIWDRTEEALWHDAGAAGLVLMAVALAATLVTLRTRQTS